MVGKAISRIRKGKGIGLNELARMSGISPTTLSGIERTNVDPGWSKVCKIADALGISLDELRKEIYNAPRDQDSNQLRT